MSAPDPIAAFAEGLEPRLVAVCEKLRATIDSALPHARPKLWHAIPAWFVGENAVVGYDIRKNGIVLMFWNGQNFKTPGLEASGSFHVGQILFTDPAQIDAAPMASWLEEAGTNVWDLVGERRAFIAKRKMATAKSRVQSKSGAKRKGKSVGKPGATARARPTPISRSKARTSAAPRRGSKTKASKGTARNAARKK